MQRPTIRTERLLLRAHTPADLDALVRICNDPEVAANTATIPHPYTRADAQAFLERTVQGAADGSAVVFAAEELATGELAGGVGLKIEADQRRAEMGYVFGRAHWRRGLATEAARAVLGYAFTELGLDRVFAQHFPHNPASGRVLAKIGMRQEGLLRGHGLKLGRRMDLVFWGLLREEWEAARSAAHGAR